MTQFTNRLAEETSPYLLQHAHNPVDWFPWGEEALQKAKKENKPILVSIGYAACHWCHVMEKESFEDLATASYMNNHFVNIKIDREERPDLDHIYMDAVQAITGSGGWPLNVFLTPDAKPFYGGTYFPPQPAFNRPSWKDTLQGIQEAYAERKNEVESQAENLTAHLLKANNFGMQKPGSTENAEEFSKKNMDELFSNLMKSADKTAGGFGQAPKFPQTFSIQVLLNHFYYTQNNTALEQACLSLDKMKCGGIYDQLGGGFARYSTDNEWLVPHFEKMLYDNALLLTVLAEAYQVTKKELYKRTIEHTVEFIQREWLSPEGGFYSALDADSEGVEGKYYVWTKKEVDSLLKDESKLFCEFFDVTEGGNWEHSNILNVKKSPDLVAAQNQISVKALEMRIEAAKTILISHRTIRAKPLLDDKILLSWNALMITALCKVFGALGDDKYRQLAVQNMNFIEEHLQKEGIFHHSYKNGKARHPAFLDDYAYLIQAQIQLQEITADPEYLNRARNLTQFVITYFGEPETGFFFFTHANQQDVILRKKEVYDGATPSGNAIMALNLYYLAIVFNESSWSRRAIQMVQTLQQAIIRYPTSFGVWATLLQAICFGVPEIALVGENFEKAQLDFLRIFIPFKIFQSATLSNKQFPLLAEKPHSKEPQFYLCKQFVCQSPVNETDELVRLISIV